MAWDRSSQSPRVGVRGQVTNHSLLHSHVTSCSPVIGQVTEQEFMAACCRDADLMRLLTPSMVQR